jgi:hypothetical protein
MDKPFDAPWGDEGEIQVKPVLYSDIVPPSTTSTTRCFGQKTIVVPSGYCAWVVVCVGAGNQQMNPVGGDENDGDTTRYSSWIFSPGGTGNVPTAGGLNNMYFTPGAPNDGRPVGGITSGEAGGGVAGYWYISNVSDPPATEFGTLGGRVNQYNVINNQLAFDGTNLLTWGNQTPFGDMDANDSSSYKYRPIAGGLLITPNDPQLAVGGQYNAQIVPQATNESYTRSPVVAGNSNSQLAAGEVATVYALPDHAIKRGDSSMEVHWLPGRQDYDFLQTQSCVVTAGVPDNYQAGINTGVNNARVLVQIIPPPDVDGSTPTHEYTLSYIGFYEVAGRCIQTTGVVPRPQPSVGAKLATSVQNSLNSELSDRRGQVTQGTCLEIAKDHPKIGPMIEQSRTMPEAKSTFKEILDFGEKLLPFAAMLI